jgi:predicted O-linked N-acetylglucosamine transferase (SPINDLY family)
VLKIGFVSGDLREHPVGYFLERVIAALQQQSPKQFELIAYSTHPATPGDALAQRLRQAFDQWHDVDGLADALLAARIHDRDQIDVLIDLAGHTAYTRLPVFACKPSPVQVSWLGYFASTGLSEMDWFIADAVTLPPEFEPHFTECIWRLPQTRLCFSPPQPSPGLAPLPALLTRHLTFGCFNHLSKMTDEVVSLWARVLDSVQGSRLLLKSPPLESAAIRQTVLSRFAVHGIEPARIDMEGLSSRYDYLASYGRIDIALDPFPYPGGTTTAESLWMGVPVLTLAGQSFLGRQGAGLMVNAGLPDWVARSEEEYLQIAVKKSADLQALSALRQRLRMQLGSSALLDAERFAQHFSEALRGMWQRHCERV